MKGESTRFSAQLLSGFPEDPGSEYEVGPDPPRTDLLCELQGDCSSSNAQNTFGVEFDTRKGPGR